MKIVTLLLAAAATSWSQAIPVTGPVAPVGDPKTLTFTPAGTGAGRRTVNAKLLDAAINIRDFTGADPTGLSDSTAAVQNAINQASRSGQAIVCAATETGRAIYSITTIRLPGPVSLYGPGGLPNAAGCEFRERGTATNFVGKLFIDIVVAKGPSPRTATINFNSNPHLSAGWRVTIDGSATAALNGTYPILAATPSTIQFATTAPAATYMDPTTVSSLAPMIQASAGAASYVTIKGIYFNGSNKVGAVGIYSDSNHNWTVEDNYFANFAAGSVAISGGENLYWQVNHNLFSMTGMAIAMQNNYGTIANGYYGCNLCWFQFNEIYNQQGSLIGGGVYFNYNDIEATLNSGSESPAIITLGDSLNDGWYEFIGNYGENGLGNRQMIMLQAGYGLGSGNYFIRDNIMKCGGTTGGSLGFELSSPVGAVDGMLEVTGNRITDCGTGIDYFATGPSNNVDMRNAFGAVTTPYQTGRGHGIDNNDTPASTNGHTPQFAENNGTFYIALGSLATTVVQVTSGAGINLRDGNQFDLTYGSTTTLATASNATAGMKFTIKALNANATLTNSVFHLATGGNYTLVTNQVLEFEVDQNGAIHEVGGNSLASKAVIALCSGSQVLPTNLIAPGAADTTLSGTGAIACAGLASTDNVQVDFNSSPLNTVGYAPSANGGLNIVKWPSTGRINLAVVNNTATAIKPGVITVNYIGAGVRVVH